MKNQKDMIDERFRIRKIVSVLAAIFQDGGKTGKFRRKMFVQSLKTIMLAIQKLKLGANRTTSGKDMIDERFRIRKIVSVVTAIFQDGGQTVSYRSKLYKRSIEGLHLRYTKTVIRWKLDCQ